jgi:hypothetical protein
MESTLLLSVSSIVSWSVFFGMQGLTWIEALEASPKIYALSYLWDFKMKHCAHAIVFGCVSAGLALCVLVSIGIVKQLLYRIKDKVAQIPFLSAEIVMATLGGFLIGIYLLPIFLINLL